MGDEVPTNVSGLAFGGACGRRSPREKSRGRSCVSPARGGMHSGVEARLVTHAWPGNVRQLAQTVQRLYVFADSAADVLDDLLGGPSGRPAAAAAAAELPRVDPREFDLKEVRRRTVRAALAATNGHLSRAAALLGVCANTMTKLVADACPERAAATRRRRPRRRPR